MAKERGRLQLRAIPFLLDKLSDQAVEDQAESVMRQLADPIIDAAGKLPTIGEDQSDLSALLEIMPSVFESMKDQAVQRLVESTIVQSDLIGRTAAMPVEKIEPGEDVENAGSDSTA